MVMTALCTNFTALPLLFLSNAICFFLIRCYRVGGYEVFHFASRFRKGNNLSLSFGPGCRWYVKQKVDLYACGSKASNDGELEEAGVAL